MTSSPQETTNVVKPYQKKRRLSNGTAQPIMTPKPSPELLPHKPVKTVEVHTLFGRRHWVVKEEPPLKVDQAAEAVRSKLAKGKKPTKGEQKVLRRDPAIMARVQEPVFISSRCSRGLTPEEVRKSEEAHKRKLMGWRYHQLAKAFSGNSQDSKKQIDRH